VARDDLKTDDRGGGHFEELAALHHELAGWTGADADFFSGKKAVGAFSPWSAVRGTPL